MQSCFWRLGYDEGFGPGEVPPTEVRKRWIDSHVILSRIDFEENWEIFDESGAFMLFLYAWLHFSHSMDKVSKLNMFYHLAYAQGIWAAMNNGISAFATNLLTTSSCFGPFSHPNCRNFGSSAQSSSCCVCCDHFDGGGTNSAFKFNQNGSRWGTTIS